MPSPTGEATVGSASARLLSDVLAARVTRRLPVEYCCRSMMQTSYQFENCWPPGVSVAQSLSPTDIGDNCAAVGAHFDRRQRPLFEHRVVRRRDTAGDDGVSSSLNWTRRHVTIASGNTFAGGRASHLGRASRSKTDERMPCFINRVLPRHARLVCGPLVTAPGPSFRARGRSPTFGAPWQNLRSAARARRKA